MDNIFDTPKVDIDNYLTDTQSNYYWEEVDEQELIDRGVHIPVYSMYWVNLTV